MTEDSGALAQRELDMHSQLFVYRIIVSCLNGFTFLDIMALLMIWPKKVVCAGRDIDVDFVTVFVSKSLLGHTFVTSIDIACLVTVYAH